MEKSENRLVQIFEELRYQGAVRTKKDFADLLEVNYANLVSAMKGDPRSYTPRMIERAEKVLAAPTPTPAHKVEDLSPAEMLRIIGGQADTIRSQQEVIARLLGAAEAKKGAV